jgi:tetratricopeptide (TPR) repeat protein
MSLSAIYFKNQIKKPLVEFDPDKSALNFQPQLIKLASFGNGRLVSSLLWSHTLLFSDLTHYDDDKSFSWLYYRFNNISEIEPYFYENYHWGGMYLSVIKDDDLGAEVLLLKGLNKFPNDKNLSFYLGMQYMFELKNYKKALTYFKLAYKIGHPYKNIPNIIIKLERHNKVIIEDSYLLPYEAYLTEKNEFFKKRYFEIAYQTKAEFDLNCLENSKSNCANTDLDGIPYFFKNNKWQAIKQFNKNLDLKK